jgi:enoyl-CoA hydratase
LTADFFREEYRLNHLIHHYKKPYIALLDGVTMGGGVGLSIHGSIRVATERTLFAMPETAIGLFPDVGGSYFLPRLPGGVGLYLALTGQRLTAADCLYAGIARQFVPSQQLGEAMQALEQVDWQDGIDGAKRALAPLTREATTPSHLSQHRREIDRCFTGMGSVERVIAALEHGDRVQKAYGRDTANWFTATREVLAKRSPTSLKVTFEQLRRGATLSFDNCMVMEYRMAQAAMRPGSDFYEGIRAVLIDKDHAPKWSPATLAEVSDELVQSYFAPLGKNELSF